MAKYNQEKFLEACESSYKENWHATITDVAKKMGVPRSTAYRHKAKYDAERLEEIRTLLLEEALQMLTPEQREAAMQEARSKTTLPQYL